MIRPYQVAALHDKGARPLLEFINEIAAELGDDFIADRLAVYARIDGATLDVLDGRDIPRPAIWKVTA